MLSHRSCMLLLLYLLVAATVPFEAHHMEINEASPSSDIQKDKIVDKPSPSEDNSSYNKNNLDTIEDKSSSSMDNSSKTVDRSEINYRNPSKFVSDQSTVKDNSSMKNYGSPKLAPRNAASDEFQCYNDYGKNPTTGPAKKNCGFLYQVPLVNDAPRCPKIAEPIAMEELELANNSSHYAKLFKDTSSISCNCACDGENCNVEKSGKDCVREAFNSNAIEDKVGNNATLEAFVNCILPGEKLSDIWKLPTTTSTTTTSTTSTTTTTTTPVSSSEPLSIRPEIIIALCVVLFLAVILLILCVVFVVLVRRKRRNNNKQKARANPNPVPRTPDGPTASPVPTVSPAKSTEQLDSTQKAEKKAEKTMSLPEPVPHTAWDDEQHADYNHNRCRVELRRKPVLSASKPQLSNVAV